MKSLISLVFLGVALCLTACASHSLPTQNFHLNRIARYSYIQADNYSSIQAAVDSLPSDGGTVYLSAHSYTVTSPIYLPANVSLVGQASGGVVPSLLASGSTDVVRNKHMWSGGGDSNITLSGFEIDGNRSGNGSLGGDNYGVNLLGVDGTTIDHLYVHHCTGTGMIFKYQTGLTIQNSTASLNGFTSSWDASGINLNQYVTGSTISYNVCSSNNGYRDSGTGNTYDGNGIRIGDWSTGNLVSHNTCNSNGRRGIKTEGWSNTITSNSLDSNLGDSMFVGGVNGASSNLVQDNTITNGQYGAGIVVGDGDWTATVSNTVMDRNSISGCLYGIDLQLGVDQATISASTISASVGYGIFDRGNSNITVMNSLVKDSGATSAYNGIELDPWSGYNPLYCTITGNTAYDDRSTKHQGFGVKSETGCDYTTLTNNTLTNNLWGGWLLAGTNNTVSGNTQ